MGGTGRKIKLGINSALLTAAIVAATVMAYYLATRHPVQYDFTKRKVNTLSPEMRDLLGKLKKPVGVIVFYPARSVQESKLRDLLEEISRRSKQVTYQLIDPGQYPGEAKKYNVVDYGLYFESGERKRMVYQDELFEAPDPYSGQEGAFKGEQAIYNAIVTVAMKKNVMLCFTEGHSEHSIIDTQATGLSNIAALLEGESFALTPMNIIEHNGVSGRCNMLIAAGPQKTFTEFEIGEIEKFMARGGKVLAMIDPTVKTGLEKVIAEYGVAMHDDLVIDPGSPFGMDASELRPHYDSSPITDKLKQEGLTINMPLVRSMEAASGAGDVEVTPLLSSTREAWGEVSMKEYPKKDPKDYIGPLLLGAAAEKGRGKKKSRAIFIGDSDFIVNISLSTVAQQMGDNSVMIQKGGTGNTDFFLNAVNWLAGDEDMMVIRPKSLDIRPLNLDGSARQIVFYLFTFVIPICIILLGGLIWNRRRSL